MKVRILDEAEQDLVDGYQFYEAQGPGLGDYFLDTLFAGASGFVGDLFFVASFVASFVDCLMVECRQGPDRQHTQGSTQSHSPSA